MMSEAVIEGFQVCISCIRQPYNPVDQILKDGKNGTGVHLYFTLLYNVLVDSLTFRVFLLGIPHCFNGDG